MHITKALIGAMLALALLPATQSEAQTQPHILPVTAASGNVAATPAVATLPGAHDFCCKRSAALGDTLASRNAGIMIRQRFESGMRGSLLFRRWARCGSPPQLTSSQGISVKGLLVPDAVEKVFWG